MARGRGRGRDRDNNYKQLTGLWEPKKDNKVVAQGTFDLRDLERWLEEAIDAGHERVTFYLYNNDYGRGARDPIYNIAASSFTPKDGNNRSRSSGRGGRDDRDRDRGRDRHDDRDRGRDRDDRDRRDDWRDDRDRGRDRDDRDRDRDSRGYRDDDRGEEAPF